MKLDIGAAITLVLAGVGSVVSGGAWVARTERRLSEHDVLFTEREVRDGKLELMLTSRLDRIENKVDRLVER